MQNEGRNAGEATGRCGVSATARGATNVMTNEYQQPDATQSERREIIRSGPAGSYFGQAQNDIERHATGRFAATKSAAMVVGSEPTVTVPGPLPIWAQGPQPGAEPPLGAAIDDVEQMLTVEHR
jgi:hypothetical protein